MSKPAHRDEEFRNGMPFFGGSLWLDLLNTKMNDGAAEADFVGTTDALRTWLAAAGLDTPLLDTQKEQRTMRELRDLLRTAVVPLREGKPLPEKLLAMLNAPLSAVSLRFQLRQDADGLRLDQTLDTGTAGPAGALTEDFARFVCDFEPARLKGCSNPACTMVFYDRGKNATRRWCTMSICGNRDKVARYRARKSGNCGKPLSIKPAIVSA